MKLNCWCCIGKLNGTCKMTRLEKKCCKEYYKRNKIKPKPITFTIDLGTIKIDKGEK